MMKLPGHVPQDIAFVWSCSEFLSVTYLTMLCFKFTCWGRRTINSRCLSCFLPTHTRTRSRTRTCTHTPHLYSPLSRCSHGWLFLTTRCLAQGLLLTNVGLLKSHRALHTTCAEACHARPRCNRRRESFYRALGNQPSGLFQLMI